MNHLMAKATQLDMGVKLQPAASDDDTEIGYWTCGERPPLVLVHSNSGDHMRRDMLRTVPPITSDDKSYTAHHPHFSPESFLPRRYRPRDRWIPSPSSLTWRQGFSYPCHKLKSRIC